MTKKPAKDVGAKLVEKLAAIVKKIAEAAKNERIHYHDPASPPKLRGSSASVSWKRPRGDGPTRQVSIEADVGIPGVRLILTEDDGSGKPAQSTGAYTGTPEQRRDLWRWLHYKEPLRTDSLPSAPKP